MDLPSERLATNSLIHGTAKRDKLKTLSNRLYLEMKLSKILFWKRNERVIVNQSSYTPW
jgi:hypothetical protein